MDVTHRRHWRDCDPSRGRDGICSLGFLIPLIGGALGLGAAKISSNATKKASNQAAQAAQQQADSAVEVAKINNALQQGIYDSNKTTLNPYIQQGTAANPQINSLLQSNPFSASTGASFTESPGYQFVLNEALRGVNFGAGAGGFLHSGARYKALQDRAAGLASQEYGNWFNQDQVNLTNQNQAAGQYLNALTGQQQLGMGAASALAGVGQNFANSSAQNNWNAQQVANQAAGVQANAALAGAGQTNAMLGGLVNAGANVLGNYFAQPGGNTSYGATKPAGNYGGFFG